MSGFRPSLHQSWDRLVPGRGGLSVPLLQPTCLGDLSLLPGLGSCLRLAVPKLSHCHLCFHLFHCLPHPHHCDCSICTCLPRAQAVLVGSPLLLGDEKDPVFSPFLSVLDGSGPCRALPFQKCFLQSPPHSVSSVLAHQLLALAGALS